MDYVWVEACLLSHCYTCSWSILNYYSHRNNIQFDWPQTRIYASILLHLHYFFTCLSFVSWGNTCVHVQTENYIFLYIKSILFKIHWSHSVHSSYLFISLSNSTSIHALLLGKGAWGGGGGHNSIVLFWWLGNFTACVNSSSSRNTTDLSVNKLIASETETTHFIQTGLIHDKFNLPHRIL